MSIRLGRLAILPLSRSTVGLSNHFGIKQLLRTKEIYNFRDRQISTSPSRRNLKMNVTTFNGVTDRYDGVTIDSKEEHCDLSQVEAKIDDSLKKWQAEEKRCIWFKVYIQDADWVPILAKRGFNFHHSRDDFVMMYKWLPDSEANLPPPCHTNLGVGGLVINDQNQLLAVSEKHYEYPHWKLPGGYVERGEDIVDAAKREVKEETGVDTEFHSVISLRHTHGMTFGNSDIYAVIMLKPTSHEITVNQREINQCQWMDLEEYLNHPNVHEFNRSIVRTALDYKNRGLKIDVENKTYTFGNKFTRNITMMSIADL